MDEEHHDNDQGEEMEEASEVDDVVPDVEEGMPDAVDQGSEMDEEHHEDDQGEKMEGVSEVDDVLPDVEEGLLKVEDQGSEVVKSLLEAVEVVKGEVKELVDGAKDLVVDILS